MTETIETIETIEKVETKEVIPSEVVVQNAVVDSEISQKQIKEDDNSIFVTEYNTFDISVKYSFNNGKIFTAYPL